MTLTLDPQSRTYLPRARLERTELATASIAAHENAEVVCIEGAFLEQLFSSHPGLPGRFFCFLAAYQAERLYKLTQTAAESKQPTVTASTGLRLKCDEVMGNQAYAGLFRKFLVTQEDTSPELLQSFDFYTACEEYKYLPDLDAINADIDAQVDAQWISDADAALQQWIVVQGYGSMASARVVDVRPDFDAINAAIEAVASTDYMAAANTEISTWVEDNEYDDYYNASSDVVGSDVANLDDDVARVNAAVLGKLQAEWTETANDEFQNWLIATYGSNATRFAALSVSDFEQDFGALNADVEAIARQIDPSLVTYEPFEAPVAMDDFVAFAVSERMGVNDPSELKFS